MSLLRFRRNVRPRKPEEPPRGSRWWCRFNVHWWDAQEPEVVRYTVWDHVGGMRVKNSAHEISKMLQYFKCRDCGAVKQVQID